MRGVRFKLCLVLDRAPGDVLDYDRDEGDLDQSDEVHAAVAAVTPQSWRVY
jgi:hypothetical protein